MDVLFDLPNLIFIYCLLKIPFRSMRHISRDKSKLEIIVHKRLG